MFCFGAADDCSVLGAVGRSAAAVPVALSLGEWRIFHLSVEQSTARLAFAWLAPISGACHVELDKPPKLNNTK